MIVKWRDYFCGFKVTTGVLTGGGRSRVDK
jgi:hypothetical protein